MNDLSPQDANYWMVVYETYNLPDAHIVAGRLQNEGIPSFIYNEPFGSVMGLHIGAIGVIKVLVNPADYERANAILAVDEPDYQLDDFDNLIDDDTNAGE
jgi:hypothetical protein